MRQKWLGALMALAFVFPVFLLRCSFFRSGNKPTDKVEGMKEYNVLQVDIEHVASGSYEEKRYESKGQSRGKDVSGKNRENMDKRHKYACLRGLMAHVPVIVISPSERSGTRGLPVVRLGSSDEGAGHFDRFALRCVEH
ncbi:hypothetical protein M0804_001033 [Polistes exclamans]|nr:hypothetical protein M0804_001033 [Polistes exclamans]